MLERRAVIPLLIPDCAPLALCFSRFNCVEADSSLIPAASPFIARVGSGGTTGG